MDYRKTAATDAFTTTLERVIQKAAEATGVLIGNKTADRIMKVSKIFPHKIIQERLQLSIIKKYLTKDMYLQK